MTFSTPARALVACVLSASALTFGCDKLKAAAGAGGPDAGEASSGGGLLSFLGGDFEGEIVMTTTGKAGAPAEVTFGIKKPRLRIDAQKGIPGGGGIGIGASKGAALIADPTQKRAWALSPGEKKAVLFEPEKLKNMPPVPGMPGLGGGAKPTGAPPKIEKAGKDKVAGYACDVFKLSFENGKRSSICAAEGITWVDLSELGLSSPEVAAAAAVSGMNHFPLRVVLFDAAGAVESQMEATRVERKKLDDARFVVPPDYQVIDFVAMMEMMRGALPPGALPPGAMPPGAMPPGAMPPGAMPPGVRPKGR